MIRPVVADILTESQLENEPLGLKGLFRYSRGSSGSQEALQVLKRLFRYSRGSSGSQKALQVLKGLFRYGTSKPDRTN